MACGVFVEVFENTSRITIAAASENNAGQCNFSMRQTMDGDFL